MSSILSLSKEEWEQAKTYYKQRLSTIMIPVDITPGVAKGLLSRIDSFFAEVRLEVAELEAQKEKVDSIIREWERVKATGSNDTVRKRNASEAIQNYPLEDGSTINLYEVQRNIAERLSFMQGVLDILNAKQSRLITISGVLKMEKDLSPHSNAGWDAGQW